MFNLVAEAGAGGAPLSDIFWGTAVGTLLMVIAGAVGILHRTGRITWLGSLAGFSSRVGGLPPWAALPAAVAAGSLTLALFGFWWDVATHIDNGRDEGAFGNLAHWPILLGLGGIALAGWLSIIIGGADGQPTAIRLGRTWHAPLGGVLIFACGAFALTGFPLDDTWHRLFGQDVTLWGPTHVLMIASASLTTVAVWILVGEGVRAVERGGSEAQRRKVDLLMRLRGPSAAGGFLIGLSSLQGEFDFGVPQFSLVLHPVMLAIAAGAGLVTARIVMGPGGALKAVAFYLVMRVILTALIGPVFGFSTQHFPLYLVEALLVEAVARRYGDARPLALGVTAGALIGTVGLAAEWGWSHVWMPIAWPSSLLGEALLLATPAAIAAGVLGAYIGGTLRGSGAPARLGPAWGAWLAAAVVVFAIAYPIPKSDPAAPVRATVDVAADGRATVRFDPPQVADDAHWLNLTAWQGGGLVVDDLEPLGNGVYTTSGPVPLDGEWKSLVRWADGRALSAIPVRLPADPVIPAAGVPVPRGDARPFVSDKSILQREARTGDPLVTTLALAALLAIMAAELAGIAYGLTRLRRSFTGAPPAPSGARQSVSWHIAAPAGRQ